jgi:CHAT domain-containing protein/Tfp pilus assembly protein PilF
VIHLRICLAVLTGILAVSSAGAQDVPEPGVIVEGVTKDLEASKAGLQTGDVIQDWRRGEDQGQVKSPLDLSWVEAEQAPRGEVILCGIRGRQKRTWRLGPGRWELMARPKLPEDVLILYRNGLQLIQEGKASEGATRWREGAAQALQKHLNLSSLWLHYRAANVFASARQWMEADEAYRQVIDQSAEAGPQIEALVWREWARVYTNPRSDLDHAEECARHALAKSQTGGTDNLGTADSLILLGNVHFYHGRLDEAENYYRKALTVIEPLAPLGMDDARVHVNLGNIAAVRGNLGEAEQNYRQALSILQRIAPEGLVVAGALNGLTKVLTDHGDLAQAEESLRHIVAIQQRLAPASVDLATSFNNLGSVAWERGDMVQAEHYLRQGLVLRRNVAPGSLWEAQSLTNLGAVALERGDLESAQKYHQEAMAIQARLAPGSLSLAITLTDLGVIAQKRGESAKAEDYHHQASEIIEKLAPEGLDFAASLQNLGEVAQDAGDLPKAEAYYRRSLAIREAVAPDTTVQAESLAALASVIKRKGDTGTAIEFFERALNVLEAQIARVGAGEEGRSGFRERHLNYYLDYVDLLMQSHQEKFAFQVLERSRARSLLEMLTQVHADIHTGVNLALLKQERALKDLITAQTNRQIRMLIDKSPAADISAVKKELDELLNRFREVEGEIQTSSPAYASLTQPRPLTVSQLQHHLLDEDTVLLEYSLGEERSYAWVISQTRVTSHELPRRSEIEATAQSVYKLLTARNRGPAGETRLQREVRVAEADAEYGKAAAELSRLVLDPVVRDIQQKRVLVVSDGSLQYIPFALLPMARSSDEAETRVPLAAEHEIVHLPSASVLAVLRQEALGRPKASKMVAVLADPVFSKDDVRVRALSRGMQMKGRTIRTTASLDSVPLERAAVDVAVQPGGGPYLPRLPFTQREARAIMATIPPGKGLTALGFDANRSTATSQQLAHYQVVHFATHGLVDNEHPELSGLVFSLFDKHGKRQNGFVNMNEIYNLTLPVDLVVLSACETGLGKNIKGEGLVGLTRAFMYAGASRVVASLWGVDDVATSEFMRRFYNAMFHEGLSPSSALRKAQLQMSQQERWRSPYYWAAFILQGEWKATK